MIVILGVCPVCHTPVHLLRAADTPPKDAKIEWHDILRTTLGLTGLFSCPGSGHTVTEAWQHYAGAL